MLTVKNGCGICRLLWAPNELGFARAYVSGDIEIEGDLLELMSALDEASDPAIGPAIRINATTKAGLVKAAIADYSLKVREFYGWFWEQVLAEVRVDLDEYHGKANEYNLWRKVESTFSHYARWKVGVSTAISGGAPGTRGVWN
jgi:hypothetical protein